MKKSNKRGLTLVELLIGVSVVGIVMTLIAGLFFRGCISSRSEAEREAHDWCNSMHLDNAAITCAAYDTDSDGYVSCTVGTKDDKGHVEVLPIECAARFTLNDGCRAPKMMTRGRFGQ